MTNWGYVMSVMILEHLWILVSVVGPRINSPWIVREECVLTYTHYFEAIMASFLFLSKPSLKWHPTPVLLPEKSNGRRSLVGYSPWDQIRVSNFSLSQFSSVVQSSPTLCDPIHCSMPRLPCPSPTPRACSNSCPLSRWCHPAIPSCVVPFSCFQSFPASGSFLVSLLFTSGGQSSGASALASVFPMNIQGWFPLGLTSLISLKSKDSQKSSPAPQFKGITFSLISLLYGPTLTSYMTTWKTIALTRWTFVGKVMPLLFNMLSSFVIAFLPRSKRLL